MLIDGKIERPVNADAITQAAVNLRNVCHQLVRIGGLYARTTHERAALHAEDTKVVAA